MEWPAHLPLVRGGGVPERAGSESEKRERKEFFFRFSLKSTKIRP